MPAPRTIAVVGDRIPDLELPPERRDEGGSGRVRRLGHLLALHLPEAVALTDATERMMTVHKLRERWCDDVLLPRSEVVLLHAGLSDAWGACDGDNPYAKDVAATVAGGEALLDQLDAPQGFELIQLRMAQQAERYGELLTGATDTIPGLDERVERAGGAGGGIWRSLASGSPSV